MSDAEIKAAAARCPICGKPAIAAFRPFCSKRCADVDLGRWLTGSYVVPATEDEDESAVEEHPKPAEGTPDDR